MSTAAELTFLSLNLPDNIQSAVIARGYTVPTPIQAQTIPYLLEGRDVLGQASTGTGKTAAFALPLLSRLDLNSRLTQVIVLCPTRELAIQVARSFSDYGDDLPGLNVQPIYGGASYYNQIKELKRGCQVVVGTPGRVMDHMRRGTLNLENLQCVVLDEADEMLRMGFVDDVKWILEQTPAGRQVALFSATMPDPIRKIANEHLKNPATVTIRSETKVADTIRSRYLVAPFREKTAALVRILETEKTDGVIVFVKTKETTLKVADELLEYGYSAIAINGDIVQKQREHTIDQLRSGKLDILVATDVAARGLDVQRISHVINYDIPHDSEAWIHRIGRTGRAGRQGEAILFLTPAERRHLRSLERATRQSIVEMEFPSARAVNERRKADLQDRLLSATRAPQFEMFRHLLTEIQQSSGMSSEDLLGAVAVLMQGDRPFLMNDVKRETRPVVRSREFSRDARGDRFGQGQERERGRDRSRAPRPDAPGSDARRHDGARHDGSRSGAARPDSRSSDRSADRSADRRDNWGRDESSRRDDRRPAAAAVHTPSAVHTPAAASALTARTEARDRPVVATETHVAAAMALPTAAEVSKHWSSPADVPAPRPPMPLPAVTGTTVPGATVTGTTVPSATVDVPAVTSVVIPAVTVIENASQASTMPAHDIASPGVSSGASNVEIAAAEQSFATRDFRRPSVTPTPAARTSDHRTSDHRTSDQRPGMGSSLPSAPVRREDLRSPARTGQAAGQSPRREDRDLRVRPADRQTHDRQRDSRYGENSRGRDEHADGRRRDFRSGESRGSETRSADVRGSDPRGRDARGSDSRSLDARSADGRSSETRRSRTEPGMETFRLEVGHEHGVQPGNIVGAIANEAGIDSKNIGRISIQDDHCFVDLPVGMPVEIFRGLKDVVVMGRHLRISRTAGNSTSSRPGRPRPATGNRAGQGGHAQRRSNDESGAAGTVRPAGPRGRPAGKPGRGQGGVRGKAARGPRNA